MTNFKPLLAATLSDINEMRFPKLCSVKLDGIRCVLIASPRTGNRLCCSRTLKPIPNLHIRRTIENSSLPLGMDGELIVGDTFQQTSSGVMSIFGEPKFVYHVFDYFGETLAGTNYGFETRFAKLAEICQRNQLSWLRLHPHRLIKDLPELVCYEGDIVADGHEGVMLRSLHGRYKFGRSTENEQILLKLKRFDESEAKVIAMIELMHNENRTVRDELGYADRSDYQDGLAPGNTMGALVVKDLRTHQQFNIGTGFSARERKEIWNDRARFVGQVLTYRYQNHGIKVAPRCPVFVRWRPDYKL